MESNNNKQCTSKIVFHIIICGIILSGIALYHYLLPISYNYFVSEDSWVEYGTFACYLWAGLLLFKSMITDSRLRNPGHILFCLALLFVAMEEISWGQRIFGIRTPYIVAKYNYQSEISLHNTSFIPSEFILGFAILIWSVVIPQLHLRWNFARTLMNKIGIPIVSFELQPYFVTAFLLKNIEVVIRNAELAELILGAAFLIFVLNIWSAICNQSKQIEMKFKITNKIVILIALATTAGFTIFIPKENGPLKHLLQESARNHYPRYGMRDQSIKIWEYLRANEALQTDETLFEYGLFLKKSHSEKSNIILLEALEKAKERKRSDPNSSAPNILTGKIYKQLENNELASQEFNEALRKYREKLLKSELNWQKFEAYQSMGEVYLEIGNYKLAQENFEMALELAEEGWKKFQIRRLINNMGDH